jgi:hypothetical protein
LVQYQILFFIFLHNFRTISSALKVEAILARRLLYKVSKKNPDADKAGALQKEISELESELDQKRVDHMIKMRKLSPNDGRGFMMGGYHMGYGSASPGDPCWR